MIYLHFFYVYIASVNCSEYSVIFATVIRARETNLKKLSHLYGKGINVGVGCG
jgi:hypothetical protein